MNKFIKAFIEFLPTCIKNLFRLITFDSNKRSTIAHVLKVYGFTHSLVTRLFYFLHIVPENTLKKSLYVVWASTQEEEEEKKCFKVLKMEGAFFVCLKRQKNENKYWRKFQFN